VVLDRDLRLSPAARMLRQPSRAGTLICCGPHADPGRRQALEAAGAEIVALGLAADGELDLPALLKELGRRQVASLLVEGGSRIHGAFWSQRLVHQVNLFYGPLILGADGVPLLTPLGIDQVDQALRVHHLRHRRFGDDLMIEGLVG
jgi:diaminohydroxyphosphoribosylaminopyrimidine deaminase/5-amino-6-(5-phosphoribosylamino)uracil reductase